MSGPQQPSTPDYCTTCRGTAPVDGPCPACGPLTRPAEPRCVRCSQFITVHGHGDEGVGPPLRHATISGGGEISLSFGYGSRHDTDSLDALICDDCAIAFVRESPVAWNHRSALGYPWVNSVDRSPAPCRHEVMVGEPPGPKHCATCGVVTDFGEDFFGYGRTAYYRAAHVNAFEHPMHRLTATKISLMQRAYRAELAGRQLKGWPLTTCYSWQEPLQKGRALARRRR